ncbi:MAG: glycosyltransferase [Chlamydiota bacterium]|nr:glycosyltransferase [Chlamydiota bacterium]
MGTQRKQKKTENNEKDSSLWEEILPKPSVFQDYEFPKVSVVVPVYNCAQKISLTIDSVISQYYPDFEIIIVDAGSTDRTVEVVKGYRDERIVVYSVSNFQPYEMMNKGISQADGEYINFLFPGDYYLYSEVFTTMMTLALEENKPSLVYCGTLLRYGRKEPQILYRNLEEQSLKRGQQPTSLQSCWLHQDVFDKIGKFDTGLELRGGYDLFCRFHLYDSLDWVSTTRVLTDYDLRLLSKELVVTHFRETLRVVFRYFGFSTALRWVLFQKDFRRYFRLWMNGLRVALFGQSK